MLVSTSFKTTDITWLCFHEKQSDVFINVVCVQAYLGVHPYINLKTHVSVFGILTYILNICVLRQEKLWIPFNLILIGIAYRKMAHHLS